MQNAEIYDLAAYIGLGVTAWIAAALKPSCNLKGLFTLLVIVVLSCGCWWLKSFAEEPKIRYEAIDGRPFVEPAAGGIVWARVRVINDGNKDATCHLRLQNLERIRPKSDTADAAILKVPLRLAASATGAITDAYGDRRLERKTGRELFDIAFANVKQAGLQIQTRDNVFGQTRSNKDALLDGDYRFTVQTDGENCSAMPFNIAVRYSAGASIPIQILSAN